MMQHIPRGHAINSYRQPSSLNGLGKILPSIPALKRHHKKQPPFKIKDSRQGKTVLRKIYSWSRIFHIYISMTLLTLLALFCLTGIFLNHTHWFKKSHRDNSVEVVLPIHLQAALNINSAKLYNNPPLAQLQALLSNQFNLKHIEEIALDEEAGEIIIDYQLPAGYATAILDTNNQALLLEYRQGSWITIMNNLHKGRHSGKAWSWVIDISAGLMLVFAVTGLLILIQNKKHRQTGLLCMLAGALTPFIIYWLWVPRLAGI